MRIVVLTTLALALAVTGCFGDKPAVEVKGPDAPGPPGESTYGRDYDNAYKPLDAPDDEPTMITYDDADDLPDDGTGGPTDLTAPTGRPYTPPTRTPTYQPPVDTPPRTYTPPPAPTRQTYVIQRGDTLWGISARHLGAGRRWKEVVAVNPGLDVKRLRIGQQIVLPPR